MKLFLILAFCVLAACAGGKAAPDKPDPLKPAVKELGRGIAWYQKGCYHKSLEHLLRAHELYAALDEVQGTAMCLNNIGNVYAKIGDPESAMLFYDASLDLYTELENSQGTIQALANKASLQLRENRLDEAQATLDAAEALADHTGIRPVSLLKTRGMLLAGQQKPSEAETMLMEALAATDPENHPSTAAIHYALGNLMADTSRFEEAVTHYLAALEADRKTGFHNGIADDLFALGDLYQQQGEYAGAAACFQRSIKIYALLGKGEEVTRTLEKLEVSAGEAGVDTTVTKHFVNQWLNGKITASPCN